ncbi:hypothetical protein CBL_02348 [Carabus blaptoides fortunei]
MALKISLLLALVCIGALISMSEAAPQRKENDDITAKLEDAKKQFDDLADKMEALQRVLPEINRHFASFNREFTGVLGLPTKAPKHISFDMYNAIVNYKKYTYIMDRRKCIFYLTILVMFLTFTSNNASPIQQEAKTTTAEKENVQGKHFDEIMKELNESLKEKAAEERKHISLLMNMTAEMKVLSDEVKGMQEKLKKITGK